ncbi:MAG: peptidase S16 [Rhodospirillales bacterium]|nr:peptidase S16 [Rhodospirillales bacterium]
MSEKDDHPASVTLPKILPVFPLEGALLLPHGHLPLHVFEPRYRAMVEAALGLGRMMGMVQPRLGYAHPIPDNAQLFNVGCAGRIVSFSETDDGRFLITLKGICRFKVAEELPNDESGFRIVQPDFSSFEDDIASNEDAALDRPRLLAAAKNYLQTNSISCDWSAVEAASLPAIITSLAMSCPFEPGEKQALLESASLTERGNLLISLFEMALIENETGAGTTLH